MVRFHLIERALGMILALIATLVLAQQSHAQTMQVDNILFAADELTYDRQAQIIRAIGSVDIVSDKIRLRADEMTYYRATGRVEAFGNVVMINAQGEKTQASYANLNDQFDQGSLENFQLIMLEQAKLAGNYAQQDERGRILVEEGVYSPCPICEDDPDKPLLWQLRASQAGLNPEYNMVYYRNVWLAIAGVPVAYLPTFAHVDPRIDRQSGWLASTASFNDALGVSVEVPYFLTLGHDKDVTLTTTQHSFKASSFQGEYRQAFEQGAFALNTGLTYAYRDQDVLKDYLGGEAQSIEGYARARA